MRGDGDWLSVFWMRGDGDDGIGMRGDGDLLSVFGMRGFCFCRCQVLLLLPLRADGHWLRLTGAMRG